MQEEEAISQLEEFIPRGLASSMLRTVRRIGHAFNHPQPIITTARQGGKITVIYTPEDGEFTLELPYSEDPGRVAIPSPPVDPALLGKQVEVTLNRGSDTEPTVTAIGKLLSFDAAGQCLIIDGHDGDVHWCWPMLDVREIDGS